MKYYIALIILLSFIIIAGCTENEGPDTDSAVAHETDVEEEKSDDKHVDTKDGKQQTENQPDNKAKNGSEGLFWKTINGKNTVYMLGSFHAGTEEMYPMNSYIEEAFLRSDYLVLEYDLTSDELETAFSKFTELQYLEEGELLEEHISEELYKDIQEVLPQVELTDKDIQNMKPWSVHLLLEQLWTQVKYDYNVGVEEYFIDKMSGSMVLKGLEAEFPPFVYDQLPEEEQEELLRWTVHVIKEGNEAIYDEAISYWMDGDSQAFANWVKDTYFSNDNLPEFQRLLLTERNEEMAESIIGFLEGDEESTYFVIAGAAHFFGPENIIQLLQDKGFEVE